MLVEESPKSVKLGSLEKQGSFCFFQLAKEEGLYLYSPTATVRVERSFSLMEMPPPGLRIRNEFAVLYPRDWQMADTNHLMGQELTCEGY